MSMKKIAILFGMENTFPPALVEKINSKKVAALRRICEDWRHPHG